MVCTWLTDHEFEIYSQVKDNDINEVFQQIREIEPIWFIDERTTISKRLFRNPTHTINYTLYQIYELNGIISKPEVRIQMSCTTKRDILNFLYGLNVGYHHNSKHVD